MDRAIVVMGKVPRPGEVKTRLAPPHIAADLYRAFLSDVFEMIGPRGVFACAASSIEEARAIAPPGWRVMLQRGRELGERIEAARADAGAERVVIVGSDAPMMAPSRIEEAFAVLEAHRAVFGPTLDGGYDLIGMTGAVPELLREIPWSTERVMEVTRVRAREAGIEIVELAVGYDLDEPADLVRALADPLLPPRSRSAIVAALATIDRAD